MAKEPSTVIICSNPDFSQQRVILDPSKRTVVFENCHQPRSGIGISGDAERVCQFEEIHAVHDFLTGNHRGTFLRIVLFLGRLVHAPANASNLGSIFISTASGRARIFANWKGFSELRSRLHQICDEQPARQWSHLAMQDEPSSVAISF